MTASARTATVLEPADPLAEAVLRELGDALAREDAAAVRRLADGYGPRLDRPERRSRGAFATPPDLAAALARHALPALPALPALAPSDLPPPVLDPACGPGALLRAAFARLVALGAPAGVALQALHGVDLDPVAVALCRAVLAVDALESGAAGPLPALLDGLGRRVVAGDALLGPVPGGPGAGGVPVDSGLDLARAFPHVLDVPGEPVEPVTGWRGGFGAVVLNPPWERLKVAGRDWAGRPPERLREDRASAARSVREGGRHPLVGPGEVNAYLPFLETAWRLLAPTGRAAAVVPAGVVSDRSSSGLLRALLGAGALESVRRARRRSRVLRRRELAGRRGGDGAAVGAARRSRRLRGPAGLGRDRGRGAGRRPRAARLAGRRGRRGAGEPEHAHAARVRFGRRGAGRRRRAPRGCRCSCAGTPPESCSTTPGSCGWSHRCT